MSINPHQLSHRDDPSTSKESATLIIQHLSNLHTWAISCVRKSPGMTQRELGVIYCSDDPRKIGRRLVECERLGLLRRGPTRTCSISGRRAETWFPIN